MSVEIVTLSSYQKQVRCTIPAADVKLALDREYRTLAKKVRLPGFRPGKAPRKVLEARFGPQIVNDVAQDLIQKKWIEVLDGDEIEAVGRPSVDEAFELRPNTDFQFSITVEVKPTIELDTYKGVEVVYPKVEVTEDEVDSMVRARLEGQARLVSVERPVELGDMVLVELTVKDGDDVVAQEPGTMIRTEADPYYPGVETLLEGMSVDEEKTETLTFGDSRNEDVSGRELSVTVKVVSVQANEVPELSDEIAEELGYEGGSEGMRAALRGEVQSARESMARNQARANLLQKLIELNEFDVPGSMVESNLELLMRELRMQQAYRGVDPRSVTFSAEQRADLTLRAAFAAKGGLILEYVTNKENLEVTEADIDKKLEELSEERGQTIEAVRGYFAEAEARAELEERLLEEKVLDWLLEQSTFVDPPAEEEAESEADEPADADEADSGEE